jgi:Zn-dependent protease with chaperone function
MSMTFAEIPKPSMPLLAWRTNFITNGLLQKLNTEGIGGVLGHEVGHVVARHSAEHIAKQRLMKA